MFMGGRIISTASQLAIRRAGGQGYEAAYLAPQYWDQFADLRYKLSSSDELSILYLASRDTLISRKDNVMTDDDGEPDPLEWEAARFILQSRALDRQPIWRIRASGVTMTVDILTILGSPAVQNRSKIFSERGGSLDKDHIVDGSADQVWLPDEQTGG